MAVGIAAATVTLSIVDATMLRPLPYSESERVIELSQPSKALGQSWPFTYRFFYESQSRLPGLEALAALSFTDVILETQDDPVVVSAVACSASLAEVLKISPLIGRFFGPEHEQRAAQGSVALLSEELWRQRFGSDPGIVGQSIRLEGRSFTVLGVMSARLRLPPLPSAPSVWIPLGSDPMLDQLEKMFPQSWDRSAYLTLWARVRSGIDPSAIEERVATASRQLLARTDVDYARDTDFRVESLEERLRSQYGTEVYILSLAALLTLAVSCANVFSLILAREPTRRVAASIHSAMGASPVRVASGVILEGVTVSLLGAASGVLLTVPSLRLLGLNLPDGLLPVREFSLNAEVLFAIVLVSVACGVGVSIIPAMRLARLGVGGLAGHTARSSTEGRSSSGSRQLIVVSQMICAVVSLLVVVVLLRTYWGVTAVRLGFEPSGVLVGDLTLPKSQASGDRWKSLAESLAQRMESQAGVASAAAAVSAPVTRSLRISYRISNRGSDTAAAIAEFRPIGPDYFKVLQIPTLEGRTFSASDTSQTSRVCVINKALSGERSATGGEIGNRIELLGIEPCEIVGIVGDVAPRGLRDSPAPAIYVPFDQMPSSAIQGFMSLLVRLDDPSSGSRAYVAESLREAVRRDSPALPVGVRSMTAVIDDQSAPERFRVLLMGAVSIVGVLLAAVGIYGISANYLAHRQREVAIRLALGRTSRQIMGDFVRRALSLAAIGLVVGFAIAYPLLKTIEGVIFGVPGLTSLEIASVVFVVALIACLAAYLPGRRIVGLNIAQLLREL